MLVIEYGSIAHQAFTDYYFFFNTTAHSEIYTLSLHDALPISPSHALARTLLDSAPCLEQPHEARQRRERDRKSTRLKSSHANSSYAVFCLKKKTCNASMLERCRLRLWLLSSPHCCVRGGTLPC